MVAAVVLKSEHLLPSDLDTIHSFSFEARLLAESGVVDTRKTPSFFRALHPTVWSSREKEEKRKKKGL